MTIESMLGQLTGHILASIMVGPAGIHFDFFIETEGHKRICDYGILTNTCVTVHSHDRRLLLSTPAFPPFACADQLKKCLQGGQITSAEIDASKNAARIILGNKVLLSLLPSAVDGQPCWSIYHWPNGVESKRVKDGFVVYLDRIEPVMCSDQ